MDLISLGILKVVEFKKKKAKEDEKFSLFCTKFADDQFNTCKNYKQRRYVYELISTNDAQCNITYADGMYLDKLAEENRVFIHRTNLGINPGESGIPKNEDLFNILAYGLENNGHLNAAGGSAISIVPPSLSLTMTPLEGIAGYKNLLSPFKDDDTIIIACFPKNLVTEDGRPTSGDYNDIYDFNGSTPTIKPDYMKGALVKKKDGYWIYYSTEQIKIANSKTY